MTTAIETKERPILFKGPMVKAIIDGRKTQTRRIVNPQPSITSDSDASWRDAKSDLWRNASQYARDCCPYGSHGDRLWVRESWAAFKPEQQRFGGKSALAGGAMMRIVERKPVQGESVIDYRADKEKTGSSFWRPSIHMPRWASRLTLEIVAIRVERLQSITEDDAVAEGCERVDSKSAAKFSIPGPVYRFEHLWKSINGDHSWSSNPWVWVIEFKKL